MLIIVKSLEPKLGTAMRRSLLTKLSSCGRHLLLHRLYHNPNPVSPLFSLSASTRSIPKFYSSTTSSPDEAAITQAHKNDAPSNAEDVITNEELKKRIAKLEEGDTEAIPDIFEGILKRLLSGEPEEAHDELRKELLGEEAEFTGDDTEGEEFDSDEESMSETDEETYNKSN